MPYLPGMYPNPDGTVSGIRGGSYPPTPYPVGSKENPRPNVKGNGKDLSRVGKKQDSGFYGHLYGNQKGKPIYGGQMGEC